MECRRWRSHCKVRSVCRTNYLTASRRNALRIPQYIYILFNTVSAHNSFYILYYSNFNLILLYWSAYNNAFDDLDLLKSLLFLFMNDIFISVHSPFVSIVHHSPVRFFLLGLSNKRDSSLNIANRSK